MEYWSKTVTRALRRAAIGAGVLIARELGWHR